MAKAVLIVATLTALLQPHFASAQHNLEPVGTEQAWKKDYNTRLKTLLAAAYRPEVLARAQLLPSFFTESVVGLRRVSAGYEVFQVRASGSVWYAQERTGHTRSGPPVPLQAREQSAPVDIATAKLILTAWRTMLGEARIDPDKQMGCDGETFVFELPSVPGVGKAQTWSPDRDTRAGKLVDIALEIAKYVHDRRADHLVRIGVLSHAITR